jgi:hypothetical protein
MNKLSASKVILVDVKNDAILSAHDLGLLPQYNILKQSVLDSEVRILGHLTRAAEFLTPVYAIETPCYLKFIGNEYTVIPLELSGNELNDLTNKKQLVKTKFETICQLLWLEKQNLKEYIVNIDFSESILYHLSNSENNPSPGIQEYASINDLTTEEAMRELTFEYAEQQNRKMRIYAWHKKFSLDIAQATTVEQLKNIQDNVVTQLWRDSLI